MAAECALDRRWKKSNPGKPVRWLSSEKGMKLNQERKFPHSVSSHLPPPRCHTLLKLELTIICL